MQDILHAVTKWIGEGRPVALATVVNTWGSAPRREGAKMAVAPDLKLVGSVSGGCVEGAVVEVAQEVLRGGHPRLLHFGVSDDSAWSVGLSCGGTLDVWLERLDPDRWKAMSEAYRRDQEAVFVTDLSPNKPSFSLLLVGNEVVWSDASPGEAEEFLAEQAKEVAQLPTGRFRLGDREFFIDREAPRPKLIVVGGNHVARALCKIALVLGLRVVLVDPRRVFASKERFPELDEIYYAYPDRIFDKIGLDANTSVVILTHDPKIDDPALIEALPSPANYVGVLSSRKTHQSRLKRLREAGVAEELLTRIRVPIGLDLGGRLPEEIALAIMAEIVAVKNGRVEASTPPVQTRTESGHAQGGREDCSKNEIGVSGRVPEPGTLKKI